MDQELTLSEHKVRREIARTILKNEDERLLCYPYNDEDIRSVSKLVSLSEEETRSILQELILDRWYEEMFKPINDFLKGTQHLMTWFENDEDEEEIVPNTIFNPWFKGHLQDFLTRFEKQYERSASDEDEQSL
jgi:hypothetical protein